MSPTFSTPAHASVGRTKLFRGQLGLPGDTKFEEGFGPRAVDIELLEKHLQRELDESLDHEVSHLITTYADWRDAYATVLREKNTPNEQ